MKKIANSLAFTLFEVLIVMTILGIIATVMVSSIKPQEYKEKAMATAAKKVMNEIDHATSMILMNDSLDGTMDNLIATDGSKFSIGGGLDKSTKLGDLYKKYLVTTRKECKDNGCSCYKVYGSPLATRSSLFYLKDGTCIVIYGVESGGAPTCYPGETTTTSVTWGRGALMLFDTNDSEEPNTYGKDLFAIILGPNGIIWDATGS